MNNSELAREMMKLAIKDSGLTTTEFLERYRAEPNLLGDAEQLKARVLNK